MNRGLSIGLLIAGIVLLVWGIDAYHSIGSSVTQGVTGAPSQKAIGLIIGGIILAGAGLAGFSMRPKV